MSLEERLRDLRPRRPGDGLRARVLGAARGARREQRLWRRTWAVAAAVLAVALPVNLMLDVAAVPPVRPVREPRAVSTDDGLRLRWRLAATPRPGPFREVTP